MIVSLQQFCLLLFEPRILPRKYPAMLVSVKISVTVNIQHIDNLKLVKTLALKKKVRHWISKLLPI
jgi:hypothetical protein